MRNYNLLYLNEYLIYIIEFVEDTITIFNIYILIMYNFAIVMVLAKQIFYYPLFIIYI